MDPTHGGTALAATLKDARSRRGLTMDQLAEMTGISTAYISLLENGKRGTERPGREIVLLLAEALAADKRAFLSAAGLDVSEETDDHNAVERSILLDPLLREEQKQQMVQTYREMVGYQTRSLAGRRRAIDLFSFESRQN